MGDKLVISYNPLWKQLIDMGWKKQTLRKETGLSTCTMAKLGKNEPVTLAVLLRICETLECDLSDVIETAKQVTHPAPSEPTKEESCEA